MSRDVGASPESTSALPPAVAECARLGERLSRTPRSERDLAWYVMAAQVGDLGALVSARLRTADAAMPPARGWDRPRAPCDIGPWGHPHGPERRWLPRRR